MRRVLAAAVLLCLLAAPAVAAKRARSWAEAEIRLVTSQGLLGADASSFRPNAPLTQGALRDLASGLSGRPPATVADPGAPAGMAQLDAKLVGAVGLTDSAYRFYRAARSAGLNPPARFGTEVAARLLGLRINHPAAQDDLELLPADPASRAEAAYSAAAVLRFSGSEVDGVRDAAAEFELAALSPWQKRVLSTAVRLIGYPYVWGGTSDGPQTLFGVGSRGGFDCSGFIWRVYRLQAYPGGEGLADTLRGRTAAAIAGEVPRRQRIPFRELAPGDLLFFGAGGPRSKPAQIDHAGIYLGNGWLIHSSRFGVALAPLDGWYRQRLAWGRRPLAEAGLAG